MTVNFFIKLLHLGPCFICKNDCAKNVLAALFKFFFVVAIVRDNAVAIRAIWDTTEAVASQNGGDFLLL
jgi:hypothetical protein